MLISIQFQISYSTILIKDILSITTIGFECYISSSSICQAEDNLFIFLTCQYRIKCFVNFNIKCIEGWFFRCRCFSCAAGSFRTRFVAELQFCSIGYTIFSCGNCLLGNSCGIGYFQNIACCMLFPIIIFIKINNHFSFAIRSRGRFNRIIAYSNYSLIISNSYFNIIVELQTFGHLVSYLIYIAIISSCIWYFHVQCIVDGISNIYSLIICFSNNFTFFLNIHGRSFYCNFYIIVQRSTIF